MCVFKLFALPEVPHRGRQTPDTFQIFVRISNTVKQVSAETGPSETMPETGLSRCQKSAVFCPNAQNPDPVLF